MKRILNLNTVYIIAAIMVVGALFVPRVIELVSLQIQGISYVAGNVDGYYHTTDQIEGEYSIEIDLSDLESNEGKVLFDDGENQIYISRVTHNESDYEVIFRSSGNFNSGGATLVSGIEHVRSNNGFTDNLRGKAQATYRGIPYKLHSSGFSGLNYRDGDEFGFYLLPSTEKIDIDLEEEPIFELSITDLYVNLWANKKHY